MGDHRLREFVFPESVRLKHIVLRDVFSSGSSSFLKAELEPEHRTTCLFGVGGIGKTTILKLMLQDKDVTARFEELHYIHMQNDAGPCDVVASFLGACEEPQSSWFRSEMKNCTTVQEAVQLAREWFSNKSCLFLVDNLSEMKNCPEGIIEDLGQLLSGNPRSKMIIATANVDAATSVKEHIMLPAEVSMAAAEAIFYEHAGLKSVRSEKIQAESEVTVKKVIALCRFLPLAISIAARSVESCLKYTGDWAQTLPTYYERLKKRATKDSMESVIRVALDILDEEDKKSNIGQPEFEPRATPTSWFEALCVLKSESWTPLSMLGRLWGIDKSKAGCFVNKLQSLNLASVHTSAFGRYKERKGYVEMYLKLSKLVLDQCKSQASDSEKQKRFHELLLERYVISSQTEREAGRNHGKLVAVREMIRRSFQWLFIHGFRRIFSRNKLIKGCPDSFTIHPSSAIDVAEDGYFHENLARHLAESQHFEELYGLLLDSAWTKFRAKSWGLSALQEDFAAIGVFADPNSLPSTWPDLERDLASILEAWRFSWQRIKEMELSLPVQLGARLFKLRKSTFIKRYLQSIERDQAQTYMNPLSGFLENMTTNTVLRISAGARCLSLAYPRHKSVGKQYFVAVEGRALVVYDEVSGNEKRRRKLSDVSSNATSICALGNCEKVAVGSSDGTVIIWNMLGSGDEIKLKGHTEAVLDVCISKSGNRIASCSWDKSIKIWDAESWEPVGMALNKNNASVLCVDLSPDGKWLVFGSDDCSVQLWDIDNAYALSRQSMHKDFVRCVAFSPDGTIIASGSDDCTVRLWRIHKHGHTYSIESEKMPFLGHSNYIRCVAFSADGFRMASASDDTTIRIWNTRTKNQLAVLEGHSEVVRSISFRPDGARLVSGSDDRSIRIWDLPYRAAQFDTHQSHLDIVQCLAVSSDGRRIVLGLEDGSVRLWEGTSDHSSTKNLGSHEKPVLCVAISPNNRYIASAAVDSGIVVRNASSGKSFPVRDKPAHVVRRITFSLDSSRFVAGSDDCSVQLYDACSGATIWSIRGEMPNSRLCSLREIVFTTKGSLIECRDDDGKEVVLNAHTGKREEFASASNHRTSNYETLAYNSSNEAIYCKGQSIMLKSAVSNPSCLGILPEIAPSSQSWSYISEWKTLAVVLRNGEVAYMKLNVLQ